MYLGYSKEGAIKGLVKRLGFYEADIIESRMKKYGNEEEDGFFAVRYIVLKKGNDFLEIEAPDVTSYKTSGRIVIELRKENSAVARAEDYFSAYDNFRLEYILKQLNV